MSNLQRIESNLIKALLVQSQENLSLDELHKLSEVYKNITVKEIIVNNNQNNKNVRV